MSTTPVALACPSCRAAIPLADVNVATDIALCRSCGKSTSFARLQASGELGQVDLTAMPRHIRELEDGQADLALVYRRRSPVLFFLLPFTALWSGGSVGMIYLVPLLRGTPIKTHDALFGLPFLFGSCILLAVIAYLWGGRWVLTLRGNEGTAWNGVGALGWTRRFTIDRTSTVSLADCGAKVNNRTVPCIRIDTGGQSVSFGAFIKDDSKQYLAARLQRYAAASR